MTQFCCWAVKGKYHICIASFPKQLERADSRRAEEGGREEKNDALLLWDVATPRRRRLGSGVLTAAQIPGDDGKKYEQKLQERVTSASCCAKRGDLSRTVARNTLSEMRREDLRHVTLVDATFKGFICLHAKKKKKHER